MDVTPEQRAELDADTVHRVSDWLWENGMKDASSAALGLISEWDVTCVLPCCASEASSTTPPADEQQGAECDRLRPVKADGKHDGPSERCTAYCGCASDDAPVDVPPALGDAARQPS